MDIPLKLILSSNFVECCAFIATISIFNFVCKFPHCPTIILFYHAQNFKSIWKLRKNLCPNDFLQDLSSRWISKGYPVSDGILPKGPYLPCLVSYIETAPSTFWLWLVRHNFLAEFKKNWVILHHVIDENRLVPKKSLLQMLWYLQYRDVILFKRISQWDNKMKTRADTFPGVQLTWCQHWVR